MKILKLDESCISNPKSEISNRTGDPPETLRLPNSIFRISDLRCRIRPISKSAALKRLLAVALVLLPLALFGQQGLDPSLLLEAPIDAWPTYHGDYSGRHYSSLNQINASNVKGLSLSWIWRGNFTSGGAIVGGEGTDEFNGPGVVKAIPLMVNGVLYFSTPDNAFAVDARTGRTIWHYFWKTQGGIHIGNRGMGMYGNWLFFETPDNYLVSLDATTGKERWHKMIADVKQEYFSTPAPLVIRNHVIVGMGGDSLDVPGWLESRDPDTGEIQWTWNVTPRPGEPGSETWPDAYSMAHGGGMPWQPPTYDPDVNLLYVPTGNPNPVMAGQSRNGDNLYTASIVALNPDTGKMVWYFQASPHDTHDWDATQVPILFDAVWDGQPRKPKRFLFPSRSNQREESCVEAVSRVRKLVPGSGCERPAHSESRKGSPDCGSPGFAGFQWSYELACAEFQSQHGFDLRWHHTVLLDVLPHRYGSSAAGIRRRRAWCR